jgi:hypothetical protein
MPLRERIRRTGARWQELPQRYPVPSPYWQRWRDGEEQDLWLQAWRACLGQRTTRGSYETASILTSEWNHLWAELS